MFDSKDQSVSMKMVLVGDGNVGKTSLLISYTSDSFPTDYVPTIFNNYMATIKYNQQIVKLWLWDTAGQEEYRRLRALSFPNTDVFLICFSLIDPKSFNNALKKWLPQVLDNCPHALKIFVGTKSDAYRQEQMMNVRRRPIILPMNIMRKKIEATGCQFYTCSALTQDDLRNVFDRAIGGVLERNGLIRVKAKKESECQLI